MRLAGVYALAKIADGNSEETKTCIEVLCAYLRIPPEHPGLEPPWPHGETQVREAIFQVIEEKTKMGGPWSSHRIRLDGCLVTYDFDFVGCEFQRLSLDNVRVARGATLRFAECVFYQDLSLTGPGIGGRLDIERSDIRGRELGIRGADGIVEGRVDLFDIRVNGTVTCHSVLGADAEVDLSEVRADILHLHGMSSRGGIVNIANPFFNAIDVDEVTWAGVPPERRDTELPPPLRAAFGDDLHRLLRWNRNPPPWPVPSPRADADEAAPDKAQP
jgi:hypothetical protein